ncbi:MAG: hypothetical protein N3F09_00600 [Bacteroidia bacterium]|nr:hypothetical protein [Bacteroidia bacterium]
MKTFISMLAGAFILLSCSNKSDIPPCCAKAGCGEECIAECKKNNCTDENCCANCATEGCKGPACMKKKEEANS